MLKEKEVEEEICECGDYQSDHEGGTGKCLYTNHHFPRGYPDNICNKFRGTGHTEIAAAIRSK